MYWQIFLSLSLRKFIADLRTLFLLIDSSVVFIFRQGSMFVIQ